MVRSIHDKHDKYFEAVLQLRRVEKKVHEFVIETIANSKIPVTKIKEVKGGVDLYMADNDYTKALGKKLQQLFGGEVIYTSSLFGKKDGKEIYRGTVLFRQAPFKKNEEVIYRGDTYIVERMTNEIHLKEKKTGKKVRVKYKEMKQIKPALY